MAYTSIQTAIVTVHWTLTSVAAVLMVARLYVRLRLRPGSFGWDDLAMLLSLALGIGTGVIETSLVEHGIGRHMDTVDPANYPTLSKLTLIASILNLLCTMTLKISLSIFLFHMVHKANRIVQRLVILNLMSLVPFTVAVIIVDLVQCVPLQGYWDTSVQAKCIDTQTVNILLKAASGVGVVTDFMTAGIPMFIIHHVQMPARRKYLLYTILTVGFFIAGASIAKTVSIDWSPKDYTCYNCQDKAPRSSTSKYPSIMLYFYDAWLMNIANPYIWRCSTKEVLVPLHQRNIGIHHCDIGCGTGYYLVHHKYTSPKATITLLDLEGTPLSTTCTRLYSSHRTVEIHHYQRDILSVEEIHPPPPSSQCTAYDSISLTYLIHTLSVRSEEKLIAFTKAKAAIKPSAVVFGATILGYSPWHSWAGRLLLRVLNWEERLNNIADNVEVFIQGLRDNFKDVKVGIVGSVLVFEARRPT